MQVAELEASKMTPTLSKWKKPNIPQCCKIVYLRLSIVHDTWARYSPLGNSFGRPALSFVHNILPRVPLLFNPIYTPLGNSFGRPALSFVHNILSRVPLLFNPIYTPVGNSFGRPGCHCPDPSIG